MLYADDIIEKGHLYLRNLNTSADNVETGTWSNGSSSYGFYNIPYERPLAKGHYYYYRATYKYSTTNQSPTWVSYYTQGGSASLHTINNPVAGTEYTLSAVGQPSTTAVITLLSGCLYNGPSNAISGVTAYAKDVIAYDVTALFNILKINGVVSTNAELKTWCDTNLVHVPRYTNYDISNIVNDSIEKVNINKGTLIADEFIEADGMLIYSVSATVRNNTYFDLSTPLPFSVYNNKGGGTVTITRIEYPDSPFYPEHKYVAQITTNGAATPGAGGFYCAHTAKNNAIFVEKFVAKIPEGYTVVPAYNGQGTGSVVSILGNNKGTGDWEEYTILYKCGSGGTLSTGGHVYINGPDNTSVTWYVAYVNNCEITGKEYLKGYTALRKKISIGAKQIFANAIDCRNMLPNGNLFNQETVMLPSGWEYDTEDYAGNAKCSLVQPVNKGAGNFGIKIPINPCLRYKISYWVKCKADMTSFLTAIAYYIGSGTEISHTAVMYKSGTKTQLSAALNPGDTTVTVKSNANWAAKTNSKLGFRSAYISYNDKGTSNGNGSTGMVAGITDTTIINLNTAYTGTAMPVNTYIVESYDGSTYPYPIQKGNLPTDNTWKYVEGYFGKADTLWDGNDSSGVWGAIPFNTVTATIRLNIYTNNGTVPIKYSDIRVEPVAGAGGQRCIDEIQIGG